jgi:hypothetical protein
VEGEHLAVREIPTYSQGIAKIIGELHAIKLTDEEKQEFDGTLLS